MLYQYVMKTILRLNSSSYSRFSARKALTLLAQKGRLAGEIQSEQNGWLLGKAGQNCKIVSTPCWMTMGKRRDYLARGELSDGSGNFPASSRLLRNMPVMQPGLLLAQSEQPGLHGPNAPQARRSRLNVRWSLVFPPNQAGRRPSRRGLITTSKASSITTTATSSITTTSIITTSTATTSTVTASTVTASI